MVSFLSRRCFFRMQKLFASMELVKSRKSLKPDAKNIKKLLSLVKRKLQRGQVPSDMKFKHLLSLLVPEIFDTEASYFPERSHLLIM